MNQIKKIILFSIILFGTFLIVPKVDAIWVYEQLFNVGSDQTLHGYDSWVIAQGTLNINTTQKYEGVRSVQVTNSGETYASRAVTAVSAGTVYFALRSAETDQYTDLQLRGATDSNKAYIEMRNNGNIYLIGATTETLTTGYNANEWYVFAIEFTGGTAKAKVYPEGGPWGGWSNTVNFATAGNDVTAIKWAGYRASGSANSWFDTITPNDPTTVARQRLLIPKIQ